MRSYFFGVKKKSDKSHFDVASISFFCEIEFFASQNFVLEKQKNANLEEATKKKMQNWKIQGPTETQKKVKNHKKNFKRVTKKCKKLLFYRAFSVTSSTTSDQKKV